MREKAAADARIKMKRSLTERDTEIIKLTAARFGAAVSFVSFCQAVRYSVLYARPGSNMSVRQRSDLLAVYANE